jgi:hypothetical protein
MYEHGFRAPHSPKRAVGYYILGLRAGREFPLQRRTVTRDLETAREMQRQLRALGPFDGAIDGNMRPQGIAAMRRLLP